MPFVRSRPRLVLPEGPLRAVDTANDTGRRCRCDEQLEAAHRVRDRAVTIDALRETVHERIFGVHDAGFEQVDDCFLARVLQLFEAADRDSNGCLADREFGRGEDLRRGDVEGLIAGVPLERLVIGVVQFLNNRAATGKRLDVSLARQTQQGRVVAAHVVCQLTRTVTESGCHDFREIGESHVPASFFVGLTLSVTPGEDALPPARCPVGTSLWAVVLRAPARAVWGSGRAESIRIFGWSGLEGDSPVVQAVLF